MNIAMASDHAGYLYKERLKKLVESQGHTVVDFGTNSEQPVDYPLFIRLAALAVATGQCERAIVLGGSGNGEAIVANRHPGVRCTLCWDHETARLSREHNDSNCLSIGQRTISADMADEITKIWLETPFAGGRHARRLAQIDMPNPAVGPD